jgi:dTDP-4-dehydrorhamnose reductase
MKILVTGREGQVARSLTELAVARRLPLIARGRPELDLTAPASIEQALDGERPAIVINAAAYTAVDKAEQDASTAIAVNSYGASLLATLCAERAIPVVHLSTDYVYDGSKAAPYVETDPVAPLGVYGQSKLDGERAVIAANPQHIVLRTAWVYSPFGHNFLKTMLRLAETRPELGVVADQVGNPTYAPHLAGAILDIVAALEQRPDTERRWGLYHAAGSGEASWHQFACEIFARDQEYGGKQPLVKPITTADYPTPARRPANSRLDCHKLLQAFGVRLPAWQDGVRECLARLHANH